MLIQELYIKDNLRKVEKHRAFNIYCTCCNMKTAIGIKEIDKKLTNKMNKIIDSIEYQIYEKETFRKNKESFSMSTYV